MISIQTGKMWRIPWERVCLPKSWISLLLRTNFQQKKRPTRCDTVMKKHFVSFVVYYISRIAQSRAKKGSIVSGAGFKCSASFHKRPVFAAPQPTHIHLSLTDKASLRRTTPGEIIDNVRTGSSLCQLSFKRFFPFPQQWVIHSTWRKPDGEFFSHQRRETSLGFRGNGGTRFQSGKLTNLITHLWAPPWTRARNGTGVFRRWWSNDSTLSTNCRVRLTWPQRARRDIMNNPERARNSKFGARFICRVNSSKSDYSSVPPSSDRVHTGWCPPRNRLKLLYRPVISTKLDKTFRSPTWWILIQECCYSIARNKICKNWHKTPKKCSTFLPTIEYLHRELVNRAIKFKAHHFQADPNESTASKLVPSNTKIAKKCVTIVT